MFIYLLLALIFLTVAALRYRSKAAIKTEDIPVDNLCGGEWKKKWLQASQNVPKTGNRYLVIGGGFLGSRITQALLARGEKHVTVCDISAALPWATDARVRFVQADVRNIASISTALASGFDTVFLTAAIVRFMDGLPFQWETSYRINVCGTQNVIRACIQHKVKHLIQTSTMYVNVPLNVGPHEKFAEEMPYVTSKTSTSHYSLSKALAEQMTLKANSSDGLKTISLRPGAIVGNKDNNLMEALVERKMAFYTGFNPKLDFVHVDNVVYAHLLAERVLNENETASGQAFNITNEEPMQLSQVIEILTKHIPGSTIIRIPKPVVCTVALVLDIIRRLLTHSMPRLGELDKLTPTALGTLRNDIVMDFSKSRSILGYQPVFSFKEGVELSMEEYKQHSNVL